MATGYWLSHKAFFCAALALQLSVIRSLNPKILRGAVQMQVFLLAQTCNAAHVRRCECTPWGGIKFERKGVRVQGKVKFYRGWY